MEPTAPTPETALLEALGAELSMPPSEEVAARQVSAAARQVSGSRAERRLAVLRYAAAAAVFSLLGTTGAAMAGALPAPMQTVAADVARAFPVAVDIPYPTVTAERDVPVQRVFPVDSRPHPVPTPVPPPDGVDPDRGPGLIEGGSNPEDRVEVERPAATVGKDEARCLTGDADGQWGECELSRSTDGLEDRGEWDEGSDREGDWERRDGSDWDRSDQSERGDSDNPGDDGRDRQEDRRDDQDQGDDRSPDGSWRDRG